MVRRDGTERNVSGCSVSCCIALAGVSPARITAGGSGSRRWRGAETHRAEQRVESLFQGGSNEAGRNKVNAEQASSDSQPKGVWECRAGHFAAKAKHSTRGVPERVLGLSGVVAAARFDRAVWNTRGPSRQPPSGKDRAHKAGAESARSRAGVRGVQSTGEGGEKPLEGRGPALVVPGKQVSARACP
jgi:hypothetical protein